MQRRNEQIKAFSAKDNELRTQFKVNILIQKNWFLLTSIAGRRQIKRRTRKIRLNAYTWSDSHRIDGLPCVEEYRISARSEYLLLIAVIDCIQCKLKYKFLIYILIVSEPAPTYVHIYKTYNTISIVNIIIGYCRLHISFASRVYPISMCGWKWCFHKRTQFRSFTLQIPH